MGQKLTSRWRTILEALITKVVLPFAGKYRYTAQFLRAKPLSAQALKLIQDAFQGFHGSQVVDYHVHLIGSETTATKNFIHSYFLSWKHPIYSIIRIAFQTAFGIEDIRHADKDVVDTPLFLANDIGYPCKCCILALDKYYDEDGLFDVIKTRAFVSNDYIYATAALSPDYLIPCISIHPHRKDAVYELEKWAERGVRMVKWIPNSMGMNPIDKHCDPFYKRMQKLNLILIVHGGERACDSLFC